MALTTAILPLKVSYSWGEDEGKVFAPDPGNFTDGDVWPAGTFLKISSDGQVMPAYASDGSADLPDIAGGINVVGISSELFTADRYAQAVDGFRQKEIVGNLIVPNVMIAGNVGFDDTGAQDPVVDRSYLFKVVYVRKLNGEWVFTRQAEASLPGTPVDPLAFTICTLISAEGTVNGRVLAMPVDTAPYPLIPS